MSKINNDSNHFTNVDEELDNIITSSQKFGIDAFDVIDKIPLKVTGVKEDIIFKIYIYRQALSSLNQDITFNFSK